MEPKKINPNTSNSSQSTASSSSTSNQVKGKGKEVINVVESLDLIIKNTKQLSVNISSESKADLNSEINKNQLFWMKPLERRKLAEKFTGLDRILYDRIKWKIGTRQPDTAINVLNGVVFGIGGLVPFVSTASTVPLLMQTVNKQAQELERSFSVDEVKRIIYELGINNTVDISKNLTKIKNTVMEQERGYETELTNLRNDKDGEINDLKQSLRDANNKAVSLEQQLKSRNEAEQAAHEQAQERERQKAKEKEEHDRAEVKRQKALQSKEKAEYEQIRDKYQELEAKAQNDAERLELANRKITELIQLNYQKDDDIVDIGGRYRGLFLSYEQQNAKIDELQADKNILENEKLILDTKKAQLEVNLNAKTRELQSTTNSKDRDIRQLQEKQLELRNKLDQAIDEAAEWEKKAKTAEGVIRLREQRIRILETEKEAAEPGFLKRNWNYCVDNNSICRWVNNTVNGFNNLIWITGALILLVAFSFVYKYLIHPMIKNFTPEPKPKEPQPTPTAAINNQQPPIIIIPPQHQIPPTNHYQPLPPQEIKVIEVETPKAVAEKVFAPPKIKSKKGKAVKKKPQNKK